ncbi:MAG: hypothetical protein AB7S78_12710 [Candidatus Omnitrophota bacterium]
MKKTTLILWLGVLVFNTACSHTVTEVLEVPGQQIDRLDMKNFLGERITLPGTYPAQITLLSLDLKFPQGHELLVEANPKIEFFSGEGELILKREIFVDTRHYVIGRRIDDPVYYIKLGIYYCKTGDQGLCLMQNVLYEVQTSVDLPAGPLKLEYNVPGTKD